MWIVAMPIVDLGQEILKCLEALSTINVRISAFKNGSDGFNRFGNVSPALLVQVTLLTKFLEHS